MGGSNGRPEYAIPSFAAAAHELKNPLVLIRQLSFDLEYGNPDQTDTTQLARRIRLTAERSLRLTQDITRAQRLEDSLFELEPIDAIALCEDVAHELYPIFSAKGRRLEVQPRRRLPLVVANRDLLRRILCNFADNALHASVDDRPLQFRVSTSGDADVTLSLRDYGPGISADIWKRLQTKDPLFQKISRRPESSGLGLYLSRQFAESMNGSLGVVRHHDGASFFVRMPQSHQLTLL